MILFDYSYLASNAEHEVLIRSPVARLPPEYLFGADEMLFFNV